jgi:alcohol dehydrogenase
MKAAQITQYGGNELIAIRDVPTPEVSEGTVLVEVHAAGVNPVDKAIRSGYLKDVIKATLPFTLGLDFSGVVTKVGPGVTEFKRGDAVYGQAGVVNRGSGSFAELALVNVKTAGLKPGSISLLEAGAAPLTAVSALQALTEHIGLKEGQKILIHGGAGGIGTVAIQLAKYIGAYVATTARADNSEYVRSFGADEVIDYQAQNFEDILNDYDAVFDTVGGETASRSFKVLRKGGIIVSMMGPPDEGLAKEHGVQSVGQITKVTTERMDRLSALLDAGVLKVHIDKTFPLSEAAQAMSYQETGHPRGKVVISMQ